MQRVGLLLLLGGFLCGVQVQGGEDQATPDLLSMVTKLQTQVQALEAQQQNRVAFFASFYTNTEEGNYGPFTAVTPIKYKMVRTNVGNGYSADTGYFTAPVKGMYVFHVSMFATYSPPPNANIFLKKGEVILVELRDEARSDTHDSTTRVAVVAMEPNERVHVEMPAQKYFYDYRGQFNSFSGFLLFPM